MNTTTAPAPVQDSRELPALLAAVSRPALRLSKSKDPSPTHLGGVPRLPVDFPWPASGEEPLAFLACIDLADLSALPGVDWLPPEGRLLFFYDTDRQPWGFDPTERDQWRVLIAPPASETDVELHPSHVRPYVRQDLALEPIVSYPPVGRPVLGPLALSSEEEKQLLELSVANFGRAPRHQVGGYPVPVHDDDMELECHLASAGVNCGTKDYAATPRARELAHGAEDWRLLLQLDTDHKSRMSWAREGCLYFWVQEARARAGDFSDAWVVFQCT